MESISEAMDSMDVTQQKQVCVHWFRHGLRLHDNPALFEASKNSILYPVFIFDGETAGTMHIGYNRFKFLLECLSDLDRQLRSHGGRLFIMQGSPVTIFETLKRELPNFTKLCFEQDCEALWRKRDKKVSKWCERNDVEVREFVSHTLWDPEIVIRTNGNVPPLTHKMFLHTVSCIGLPPRPIDDIDFTRVTFGTLPDNVAAQVGLHECVPKPEQMDKYPEPDFANPLIRWVGGESEALIKLTERLSQEIESFKSGVYLSNQVSPDLTGPPTSQSAALKFGCLSVRRFYWALHDHFNSIHEGRPPSTYNITGQLIWREYFYTMSAHNPFYDQMEKNKICLNIPWLPESDPNKTKYLNAWKNGQTGYPFIDAVMRQLRREGWVHHVARNAVACFLTRGDLWINWEDGAQHFFYYLLDADWSVNAGNWMWVSSSAFEQLLDCTYCVCPVNFGRRLDPDGVYIKRYVPELRQIPNEYIYEPWKAPLGVQEKANCIISKDYPERIVNHVQASLANKQKMLEIRNSLLEETPHCRPADTEEVYQFMMFPENCNEHLCANLF
uniref:Cryptochrome-1 n=2 Tax=Cacopsylla melanoneura TaxID=428564 RepID=A0A8D8Y8F0_9HEMI